MRLSQLTTEVFQLLNQNSQYAVLRNYSGLPGNNPSRDIDILIEKVEFLRLEKQIVEVIEKNYFYIITLYKSEKIVTYVCASVSGGKADLVQFDFFFNTSIFGFLILDPKDVLSSRIFNKSIYHVSEEYEFLDKYLQLKFLNKPYPHKYRELSAKMRESAQLPIILQKLLRKSSIEEIEIMSVFWLRVRLFRHFITKKPLSQISLLYHFGGCYIQNIVKYKGFSIGFTGPDGSGKTTVINLIIEELGVIYSAIKLIHFRPGIIPNLGEVAHKVNLKSEVDSDFSNPHRGGKTGNINSMIRLLYLSLDYVFGYFFKVRSNLQNRSIVIFDRYYTDVIADSPRTRIHLKSNLLYLYGQLVIPQLDYNILLTADAETILSRKQELTPDGIKNINTNLHFLAKKKGYLLVKNNGTQDEAVQEILTLIFKEQHFKCIKALK